MKSTQWTRLDARECVVKSAWKNSGGSLETITIKHAELSRARYFTLSQRGNWYSRYTHERDCQYAEGYIIVGDVAELEQRALAIAAYSAGALETMQYLSNMEA